MFCKCISLVMVIAAAAAGQTAPASVAGTVTNALTGEPLLRAHVSLRAETQTYGALTNGEGQFAIASLPPGTYRARVDRVGFVSQPDGSGKVEDYTLAAGDKITNLKIALTPLGAITGRVLDATGEPMAGIGVSAEASGGAMSSATSDDRGQFRLGGLRPGKYRVKATPQNLPFPPEIRSDGTQEVHYSTTYFPNSLTEKSAQRVDVKSGANVGATDVRLVATPVVRVSGRVMGIPPDLKNVTVQVQRFTPNGGTSGSGGAVKPDGSYEIWGLDPGPWTLLATSSGPGGSRLQSAQVEIEVTTLNVDHVDLQMAPPFSLSGQLRFEQDQPPKTSQAPQTTLRRLFLQSSGGGWSTGGVEVGADDSFTIEKMQPGRYHLSLSGISGYVRSVRAGATETEGDLLDALNGPPGPVTVMISSNFAEVSGTVNDFKGTVPGATVVLARRSDIHQTEADASGTYHFQNLRPGTYSLIALEDGAAIPRRGEELDDYEDSVQVLELRAGDKVSKDLRQRAVAK